MDFLILYGREFRVFFKFLCFERFFWGKIYVMVHVGQKSNNLLVKTSKAVLGERLFRKRIFCQGILSESILNSLSLKLWKICSFEKELLSSKQSGFKPRYSWINQLSLLLMKYINLLTTNLKLDAFFFPHLKLLTKFGIKVLLYLGKFLNYNKQRVFLYDKIQNGKMLKSGFLRVGRYFS